MGSNNPENSNTVAGALTYPVTNNEQEPVPVQPRQPRNLQGLLRFAMEATKAEDAPGNSGLGPMDEQRREFLEEALRSLTVNVGEVLQKSINVLTDTDLMHSIQLGDPLPDDVKTSFNNLLEFIDDIDVANDFCKMGGFAIFPVCYGGESEAVRALASAALAELCQNNPFCQARALDSGLLNVLLNLAQTERRDALAKCLYAISCSIREYEPACRELIAQGGCATLAQHLRAAEHPARIKASLTIKYLYSHYIEAKEQFIQLNIVKTIAEQIQSGADETTEYLLSVLLTLIEDRDPTVLSQFRNPSLGLKKTLEDLKRDTDLINEEFLTIFEDCPQVEVLCDEVADR